jgi:hypothetical protein
MNRVVRWLKALSPRAILAIGWLGLFLYAYPGYMSFDSIAQLHQARVGFYLDSHPPAMAAMWSFAEHFVTGPVGLLLAQTGAFAAGVYLLLATRMQRRTAAIATALVLWFPPVANTMSVIWKDSQMAAYLVLGTALMLAPKLRSRLIGLAFIALATAMRHNAFAMTLPLVVLLFYWKPLHRWWQRYAIAIVAWLVVTASAQAVSNRLADQHVFMWHQSLALLDIVGTLRYAEPLGDDELRRELAGTPLAVSDHFQDHARAVLDPAADPVSDLWNATSAVFDRPADPDEAERTAIVQAWKAIVFGHPAAYLRYRLVVFGQLVQLDGTPLGSPIYCWFTDIQQPFLSGVRISHLASDSRGQELAHEAMFWLGDTWMFHVGFYMILSVVLLPLCWRDRESFALIASGLSGQAGLFVIAPSVDVRYSFWLIVATVLAAITIAARRLRSRGSS